VDYVLGVGPFLEILQAPALRPVRGEGDDQRLVREDLRELVADLVLPPFDDYASLDAL
jgi:hypothetical protein